MSELSFGQRIDPENGLVECWFTHGALDAIKQMDLSNKVVWMWGAGLGDKWLASRCAELHIVERDHLWMPREPASVMRNTMYHHRPCNEGSGAQDMYCDIPIGIHPDVFIVDDAYRFECILKAIQHAPCTLIVDNWQQDYVFMCPAAEEALKAWQGKIFTQEDHKDHEGHPWKTGIWEIK